MRFGFLQLSSQGRAKKFHQFVHIGPLRIAQSRVFADLQQANAIVMHYRPQNIRDLGESHSALVREIGRRKLALVENIGVEVHQN